MVLPPAPPLPRTVQGVAGVLDRRTGLRALRSRYGPDFTVNVPVFGTVVVISDPDHVRQVFTSPPSELDTVTGSLGRVMGPNSLFALTGEAHRAQRKLLVPPFHGRRLRSFAEVVERESLREFATWPEDREFATQPAMMRITLNAILRAVFGAEGSQFERLQQLLPTAVALGSKMSTTPLPQWNWSRWSAPARFLEARGTYDGIVDELIAAARADPHLDERTDVLAVLLQSRYDDGSAMTREAIADQLVTLLTAGYETTATTLAWAIERLRRQPDLLTRLVAELGDGSDELLDATLAEVQRARPVVDITFRAVAAPSYRLGPWTLPHGQTVLIAIGLVLENDPDTWIPYGGGTRRCIGAAFADMEMRVVLRTLLRELTLHPTTERAERRRTRGVAMAPARGGRAVVSRRE